MRNIAYIFILLMVIGSFSCKEDERDPVFKETNQLSIYDYLVENKEIFSSFLSILEKSGIDKTLSAYNPDGNGYTLFAPDNAAVQRFIDESPQFSSLTDILNDQEFAMSFSCYHVVNMSIRTNDFPFGAFSEPTLSDDYLIVSFVIDQDSSYYRINNQASVTKRNIETSNGFVHHIETALQPVTLTAYQWLEQNPALSIFKSAVDLAGLKPLIDFNLKVAKDQLPVTLLIEPDSIYNKRNIRSAGELAALISPGNPNYTDSRNNFYNYVAYHFLSGNYYIDDFVNRNTNYNTMSEIPLNIDGWGVDIAINPGKQVFDTIVYMGDTTIVNFIKILYDQSNVVTQSGAIHLIDQVMKQQVPTRASTYFQFYEEPLLNGYNQEKGEFLIEKNTLNRIHWTGPDLFYVAGEVDENSASNYDYLMIDGDFTISYTIPKIVQGKYRVNLRAESFNATNSVLEVYIDNKKVGGMVDLSVGGTATSPFRNIALGTVEFSSYEEHDVEVRCLIPGRFLWDYIRFEPY